MQSFQFLCCSDPAYCSVSFTCTLDTAQLGNRCQNIYVGILQSQSSPVFDSLFSLLRMGDAKLKGNST